MSGRPSLRPAHSPSPFHKPAVSGRRNESQSEGKTRASWWLSLACGDGSTWHHDVRIAVVGVRMNLNLKEKRVTVDRSMTRVQVRVKESAQKQPKHGNVSKHGPTS